jgi:glycogen debranching enzyme
VYSSPPHVSLPLPTSPPPPSPDMYDPLSPPVSGSDTSADGIYHHSNSSGANSPSSSRGNSLVHRHIRYNPTPSPSSSAGRPRRGRSQDSDDENDMGVAFTENLAHSRKEATRRQRIEAEQRRRDELRDGYAKLKEVLPISNQKSSKVSLLERGQCTFAIFPNLLLTLANVTATNHITALEKANKEMQARLTELEQEMVRLRAINEKISLGSTETPSPGMFDGRPLSPPPDGPPAHSLASVRGQEPPSEHSSPSASEGGF